MRKQYLVRVKLAFDDQHRWWNAVALTSGDGHRYATSLEDARSAVRAVSNRWPNDPDQRVTEVSIRVREVTEWEDVDESALAAAVEV